MIENETIPNQASNKKKLIFFSILGLVSLVAATCITVMYGRTDSATLPATNEAAVLGEVSTEEPATPTDLTSLAIVLLGYGGPGHQGGYLSDVIQLVHIDFAKSSVTVISIPRDLWVALPNGTAGKVNTAFALGSDKSKPVVSGGPVAAAMAEVVTGLDVPYFAAVDFVGFERLVGETLDGLEVVVTEPFEDAWYPIRGKELEPCGYTPNEIAEMTARYSGFELEKQFPCRYEHLKFPSGTMIMEGGDALKYVRSRHGSSGGDFSRSKRQHDLLLAVRDRLFSLEVLTKIPEFYELLTKNISTNLGLETAQYIAPALDSADAFTTKRVILSPDNVLKNSTSDNGQYILIPKAGSNDWSEVHQLINKELGG